MTRTAALGGADTIPAALEPILRPASGRLRADFWLAAARIAALGLPPPRLERTEL